MAPSKSTNHDVDVEIELASIFLRNGYKRVQDAKRLKKEGWAAYKKGFEVRLVAQSAAELRRIRTLLRWAGFQVANSYAKGLKFVQPIYGEAAVKRFEALAAQHAKR